MVKINPIFRMQTNVVYPPFKNGRYLEEFFYDFAKNATFDTKPHAVYIPAFWTNIQIHKMFLEKILIYQKFLDQAVSEYPSGTRFFTVVQHDDGVILKLPKNTTVFGTCSGNIPIPLIYEDVIQHLKKKESATPAAKTQLATFVGTITHGVRTHLIQAVNQRPGVALNVQEKWTDSVDSTRASLFIDECLKSRFTLSPRGYGRSSFRFFEAMVLGSVPVYVWDDKEWLPYKEYLDYSKFSISCHASQLGELYDRMNNMSDTEWKQMIEEGKKVAKWFSLEGMSQYILSVVTMTSVYMV